jgi:hypothetical protein
LTQYLISGSISLSSVGSPGGLAFASPVEAADAIAIQSTACKTIESFQCAQISSVIINIVVHAQETERRSKGSYQVLYLCVRGSHPPNLVTGQPNSESLALLGCCVKSRKFEVRVKNLGLCCDQKSLSGQSKQAKGALIFGIVQNQHLHMRRRVYRALGSPIVHLPSSLHNWDTACSATLELHCP